MSKQVQISDLFVVRGHIFGEAEDSFIGIKDEYRGQKGRQRV